MQHRSRALATAAAAACLVGLLTPATATATDARPPSPLPAASATGTSLSSPELAVLASPRGRDDLLAGMSLARIPADAQERLNDLIARLTDAEVEAILSATRAPGATADVRAAILSVLDPADYQCDESTALDEYVAHLLSEADLPGLVGLLYMINFGLLDIQTYEALLFAHDRPNTFGDGDEYAKPLAKAMRQARSFWDVDTDDVVLGAMDADLWVRLKGDSAEAQAARRRAATAWATWGRLAIGPTDVDGTPMNTEYGLEIIGLFEELLDSPYQAWLDHGRNDLFTLNAFAFTTEDDEHAQADPDLRTVSDRIIFGPGILHASKAMGYGEVGPRGILAHEFMHHVQYENGVEFTAADPADQPASTRRTELMADAGASYFATHKPGLTLNAGRLAEVAATFYAVGDCSFDSAGHHGTPQQRERASTWGSDLAAGAQKQGHVLPSAEVIGRFEAVLPDLVAPDAS